MNRTRKLLWTACAAASLAVVALCDTGGAAAGQRTTVVELFTSQGCSSCPPANLNLGVLSKRSDVLALSFGVTYWDYIGWKDIFAKPEFTDRQVAYEPGLGHGSPFTPQMVIDGKADAIGNRLAPVEALIASSARSGPPIEVSDGRAAIGAGEKPQAEADIWVVFFDERTVEVAVKRGENSGRTLPHTNVVRHLARIGGWDGAPVEVSVPRAPTGLSTAILVQARNGGPILAAARQNSPAS